MPTRPRATLRRYRTDLRGVVGSSATAYGYTLTVWSTGAVLSGAYGPPSPPQVFSFLAGAVVAFAVAGVLAFGGVTSGFHFLSVGLAVAMTWLISSYAPSFPGWPLAAFVATGVYLLVVGLEQTAADRQTER